MRKFFFLLLFAMYVCIANAQGIYTKVTKYDKFDDVEWTKNVKTLITQTDTAFIFETKGSAPEIYRYIDTELFAVHYGRRDSLTNLVADIWGYESQYITITDNVKKEVSDEFVAEWNSLPDSLKTENNRSLTIALLLMRKADVLPTITVRTVSKYKFSYEYQTDLIWIKFEDGSRIIYEKD